MDNNEKKPETAPEKKPEKKPEKAPDKTPEKAPERKQANAPAPKKKKVTKKVLRQRQLCALAVIALILLILIIALAKGCSSGPAEDPSTSDNPSTTSSTTTTTETTTEATTTTTEPVTTTNPLAAQVQLSTRELFINVGATDVAVIQNYPEDCTEANEVWRSLDESIASVDTWGYVTGVSKGETFIVLSFDNHPDIEIEIKVSVADTSAAVPEDNNISDGAETPEGGDNAVIPDVYNDGYDYYSDGTPTTPVYGYTGEE